MNKVTKKNFNSDSIKLKIRHSKMAVEKQKYRYYKKSLIY